MGHASRVPAVGSRRHPTISRLAPRLVMMLGDGRNENSSARKETMKTKKSSFKKDTLYPRVTAAVHTILHKRYGGGAG